jgi:hypothetical protein
MADDAPEEQAAEAEVSSFDMSEPALDAGVAAIADEYAALDERFSEYGAFSISEFMRAKAKLEKRLKEEHEERQREKAKLAHKEWVAMGESQ